MDIPDNQRKYCTSCGAAIYKEAVMCPQCGAMQNTRESYEPKGTGTKPNWFLLAACVIASLDLLGLLIMITQSVAYRDYLGGYGPIIFVFCMAVAVAALWTSFLTKSRNGVLFSAIVLFISPIVMPSFTPFIIFPVIFAWIGFAKSQKAEKEDTATQKVEIPSDIANFFPTSTARPDLQQITRTTNIPIRSNPSPSYKYITIRVVGVTFDNENGTNRQNILRHIRFRDPPFDDAEVCAELHPYDFNGEDAISVLVADQTIGNIPKTRVQEIMDHWENLEGITAIDIIGGGKDEFGNRLNYGAEITIRFRS